MSRDPRVDAYIARKADFARPILEHIRAAFHAVCPDCEEAIKWGAPGFVYKGKLLAMMAAFKAHAALNFHHGISVAGEGAPRDAMGQFGRLASVADLPDEAILAEMIRRAVTLAESGAAKPRSETAKADIPTPDDLAEALAQNNAAAACFDGFSPSARREYAEWIVEAKRPETRSRRVAQAVEWIAQGKKRNWKYEKC